jgi:diphthamide synthase (EF-2-diphthine--ammonia ligase)
MPLQHDDIDRRCEGLASKNIDEDAGVGACCFNMGQIVEALRRAIVDKATFGAFNLDYIPKWRKSRLCQRLNLKHFKFHTVLPTNLIL